MMRRFFLAPLTALLMMAAACCEREPFIEQPPTNLLIFYTCGHDNGLSGNINTNLNELLNGTLLPSLGSNKDVIFFLQHSNASAPVLYRLGYDESGKKAKVQTDWEEMPQWASNSVCISSDTLSRVLAAIQHRYPAKHSYLIVSSHASGWLPAGYYGNLSEQGYIPIATTIGQELAPDKKHLYEMELTRFAARLPFHFDAIFFDACLMGGVETAFELRNKCDYVGFSPTEILAHGMYYDTMVEHLTKGEIVKVAEDYMSYYRHRTGSRCGTYSVIDCQRLDTLARACSTVFANHRAAMAGIDPESLQQYFRGEHPWYYDLRDVAVGLGATEEEMTALDGAFAQCVVFKDHTETFLELNISHSCGLSTYLPKTGNDELNTCYKKLRWNGATEYVE